MYALDPGRVLALEVEDVALVVDGQDLVVRGGEELFELHGREPPRPPYHHRGVTNGPASSHDANRGPPLADLPGGAQNLRSSPGDADASVEPVGVRQLPRVLAATTSVSSDPMPKQWRPKGGGTLISSSKRRKPEPLESRESRPPVRVAHRGTPATPFLAAMPPGPPHQRIAAGGFSISSCARFVCRCPLW